MKKSALKQLGYKKVKCNENTYFMVKRDNDNITIHQMNNRNETIGLIFMDVETFENVIKKINEF